MPRKLFFVPLGVEENVHVEPEAGNVGEKMIVGDSRIHAPGDALIEHVQRGARRGGEMQCPGKVVAGAEGENSHGGAGAAQRGGDLIHCAVAADGHNALFTFFQCGTGKGNGVPGALG